MTVFEILLEIFFSIAMASSFYWNKQYKKKEVERKHLFDELQSTRIELNNTRKSLTETIKNFSDYMHRAKAKEKNLNQIIKVLRASLQ